MTKPPLKRPQGDRMIAGVCAGLARHLGMDTTLMRVLFVLGLFFVGGTLLVYLVLIFVIPSE